MKTKGLIIFGCVVLLILPAVLFSPIGFISRAFLSKYLFKTFGTCESSTTHCNCVGLKISFDPAGMEGICLGLVREKWGASPGPFVIFYVTPPSASATIYNSNVYSTGGLDTGPTSIRPPVEIDHIGVSSDGYTANVIQLDYPYEIRNGKIEFHKKTPVHIEVKNPGYKTWTVDLIPQVNEIKLNVNLERENP